MTGVVRSRSSSFTETFTSKPLASTYDWTSTTSPRVNPLIRLFYIPHSGAFGSNPVAHWGKLLPDTIEVVTLLPGGKERRNALASNSPENADNNACSLVDGIIQVLASSSDKPYALMGHSAGAALALHVVATLQRQGGVLPMHLFISSCGAPQDYEPLPSNWREEKVLLKLLEEWGGTDSSMLTDPEVRSLLLAKLRADVSCLEHSCQLMKHSVEARPKLNCNLSIIGGIDDDVVTTAALEGWKNGVVASDCEVEVVTFPGGHFYLEDDPKSLLEKVSSVLNTALIRAQDNAVLQVRSWNNRTMEYPSDKCLHQIFVEQAKKTPSAIAICDPPLQWTYAQLDEETDIIASYLVSKGCGRDKVVGLLMARSAAYVIGYIAAHKAGGAYAPLEIAYPPELIERVLKQTDCVAVLTQKDFSDRLPQWQESLIIDNAGEWKSKEKVKKAKGSKLPPSLLPTPDSLAYVVMSSGTTGTPKGICCPHRGAVHSYTWRHLHFPLQSDDRVACAVFFVWEFFRPLMRGLPVYIIPDDVIYDAEALSVYLQEHRITRILFTPSLLQLILDTVSPEILAVRMNTLRIVWLCGEVVTIELQHRFKELFPRCQLLNLYSISECHDVSVATLEGRDEVGTPGEVYVGGPCLARGYLKMPGKTAERFVPNPFLSEDGPGCERLYRTGDRGRFMPDGTLELAGRCDFMVKIRGYSVVLGAVEAALAEHDLVSTAVVVAEGAEGTDKRLCAYIVPQNWEKVPSARELKTFIKSRVPFYAVPPVILLLNALPVAAIGKLDRKKVTSAIARRLPATTGKCDPNAPVGISQNDAKEDVVSSDCVPLEGETEIKLAKVWSKLLKLDEASPLSADDSFFEAGGHSLLAVRLVAKIRDAFFLKDEAIVSTPIKLSDIIRHPTLRALANVIKRRLEVGDKEGEGSQPQSTPNTKAFSIDDECSLDDMIYPAATRKIGYSRIRPYQMLSSRVAPRRILLTGATGFLGTFVLAGKLKVFLTCFALSTLESFSNLSFWLVLVSLNIELLENSDAIVYCLVRANDDEHGFERIERSLRKYQLLPQKNNSPSASSGIGFSSASLRAEAIAQGRMVVAAGDLGQPLLGLSKESFQEISTVVDVIVHCGAEVNLVKSYEALKKVNVLGTQEVLRAAVTNGRFETRVKPVYFVSTNGIFPYGKGGVYKEEVMNDMAHLTDSDGYAQSKYVAETLVLQARGRGLPVAVLRCGNLAGSSTSGQWQENDFVRSLLFGCKKLNAVPDPWEEKSEVADWAIDLTPVDFAAVSIVHLVMNPVVSLGKIFHIQSPHEHVPAKQLFQWLAELGMEKVSMASFRQSLQEQSEQEAEDKGDTTLQRLAAGFDSFSHYFKNPPILDVTVLQSAIEKENGIKECAKLDEKLLELYLNV
eukprot:g2007.t1